MEIFNSSYKEEWKEEEEEEEKKERIKIKKIFNSSYFAKEVIEGWEKEEWEEKKREGWEKEEWEEKKREEEKEEWEEKKREEEEEKERIKIWIIITTIINKVNFSSIKGEMGWHMITEEEWNENTIIEEKEEWNKNTITKEKITSYYCLSDIIHIIMENTKWKDFDILWDEQRIMTKTMNKAESKKGKEKKKIKWLIPISANLSDIMEEWKKEEEKEEKEKKKEAAEKEEYWKKWKEIKEWKEEEEKWKEREWKIKEWKEEKKEEWKEAEEKNNKENTLNKFIFQYKKKLKNEILSNEEIKYNEKCMYCNNNNTICISCQYSFHGENHCYTLVCLECVEKCEHCYMYFCPLCYQEDWTHK